MALEGKPIQSIIEADLAALITDEVVESKLIEYKSALPEGGDDEKREFLADVSSFANASGGFIVYGMQEEAGRPTALDGVACDDPDALILRLESIVTTCIDPRIPGLETRCINLDNGNNVLLMHIPQSWIGPHMVTFKNHSRFYSRSSAGKYQLDVREIGQAFLLADSLGTRIRNFHLEKLSKVISSETPVQLPSGAKVVMHLIPTSSFQTNNQVEIKAAGKQGHLLHTLSGSPDTFRYNLDGVVSFRSRRDNEVASYVQLFRNGVIEVVDSYILRQRDGANPYIPSIMFERAIINTSGILLSFQRQFGIIPPTHIFVSLGGVKGYKIVVRDELQFVYGMRDEGDLIDRDVLLLPDVLLDNYENVNPGRLYRPLFDAVWNATGWPECMDYDEDGNWVERR